MNNFTLNKSDIIHIGLGLISALVWLLGKRYDLPVEAVDYAHTTTIALCGSAFGIAVATDTPSPTVTK